MKLQVENEVELSLSIDGYFIAQTSSPNSIISQAAAAMKHLNASNARPSLVLLLLLQIIILVFQTPTRAQDWETDMIGVYQCSDNSSSYTSGSQFESNLISYLFPTLITNGSRDGFVVAPFGEVPDKIYGLVQCRGDISKDDCQSCLKISTVNITQTCPNRRSAGIRLGNCLIRYSDISFFNKSNTKYTSWTSENAKPIPNLSVFNQRLEGLFSTLNNDASKIPSRFKTGSTEFSELSNIYGLVQCTQDLSTTDCFTCLQKMLDAIPSCCSGAKGVWIPSLSCQIIYDGYLFFRLPSPPPPLLLPPLPQQTPGLPSMLVLEHALIGKEKNNEEGDY